MAVSFIDVDTLDFAGAQSLSFTIPAGAITDDFMIAFVKQSENTGQQTWDDDGGGGNGWTREVYNRTTGGRDQETAIYWKIHTGSETNPTFTWNSGGINEQMSGSLLVYRGVDTLTPFSSITFLQAQNDANPPNPNVPVDTNNSWVMCFHAATHDDITTTAPPTGFTMRAEVWNGTADDHRNHFVADSNAAVIAVGTYSPPDWQHSVANTTPEYHTYSISLNEVQPIGISTYPAELSWGATGLVVTGFGFEATQNTGKVEYWSDVSGTIKQTQTIISWSDTSITFDSVQGSLSNNTSIYLVVTNDSGDVTPTKKTNVGLLPYQEVALQINPDHWWALDGNYNDTGVGGATRNMTSGIVGTHPFVSAIAEDAAQGMQFDDVLDRREIADSPFMNVTIDSAERTVGGWIQLGGIQQSMGAIWKEGGGIQNLAFIIGLGNVLMAQEADTAASRDNVQAVSEIKLAPDRPYHIVLRYSHTEPTKETRLFLDGIEQPLALTDGNPMTTGIFNSHSGDVTWGDPDNNLETGTTDIAYAGQEDCIYNHWFSWSDNSIQGGALNKTTEILDVLFKRGALPLYTIVSDTQANMQIALDALGAIEVGDYPIGIRIEAPSSGNDLTLIATGLTFNSRVSQNIEWRGAGILTWIVETGSDVDETKIFSATGGTFDIQRPASFTINGIINGAEVRIYDDDGIGSDFGTELDGVESISGTTFIYSHNGVANGILVQMIHPAYVEIKIPFSLTSTDQILNLIPKLETN
jgi:hypothetical protein